MATTIENFFNQASQKQFSRDFLFRIKQISVTGLQLDGETDLLYARSASLPGRNIENKAVNHSGQQFNASGKSTYPGSEAYSIEFYCDQSMEIRSKLEAASRVLFDNNTTTGTLCMPGVASKIVLDVLKVGCQEGPNVKQGSPFETIKTVELVGAALRDIGEISYQIADGTGEIITFSGTFSYHFYNIL